MKAELVKKRVYIESTVISYLAAKPARDLVKQARQFLTREWWEQRRRWDLYISTGVMREIQLGNRDAARRRVAFVNGLSLLPETEEAGQLADYLIKSGLVPESVRDDALHIATATVHGMDYLVTWNQKHIFNPFRIEAMYAAIRKWKRTPPVLIRPDNLGPD